MDDHRFKEIQELVDKFLRGGISFEEFDGQVSENEYSEWSSEANRKLNEKVNEYLNSKNE